MTDRSAPLFRTARLAVIAAAGFFCVVSATAQTRLPPPPASLGAADVQQDRIQGLEAALRDAEARNEDLQRQLNEANREIARLRGMVGELAGVNQSLSTPPPDAVAPPPGPQTGAAPGGSADLAPPTLNDAQRRATGTLGSIPATATPPPAPAAEPGQAYSRARELLVNGQYPEAEVAFAQFLEQFPNAEQAADARFWFAFTLLARNNYRDAAQNFTAYLRANPQAPRAAEAQVRLGMALIGLSNDGQNDAAERRQACAAFTRLPQNAPRNVRDLAAREASAARCSA